MADAFRTTDLAKTVVELALSLDAQGLKAYNDFLSRPPHTTFPEAEKLTSDQARVLIKEAIYQSSIPPTSPYLPGGLLLRCSPFGLIDLAHDEKTNRDYVSDGHLAFVFIS